MVLHCCFLMDFVPTSGTVLKICWWKLFGPKVFEAIMFNLNDTMRYFLCPGRTDMQGISSLCGVVHEKMNSEVRNGDVFIFIGSSRRLMKLLHTEDGGIIVYVKRLEAGRSSCRSMIPKSNSYPMEWRDLVMMVEGIQENPEQRLRRLRAERKGIPCIICFYVSKLWILLHNSLLISIFTSLKRSIDNGKKEILLKTIEGLNASIASLSTTNKESIRTDKKSAGNVSRSWRLRSHGWNRQLFGQIGETSRIWS